MLDNIRLWDELFDKIESSFPFEKMDLLRHFSPGQHLLDYGCGSGRVISFLREHGFNNVTGCDTSSRMCDASRSANPHNRIILMENPNVLTLDGESFDGVILVGVLSSVIPHIERKSLVEHLATYIRKGGKVVVGDFGCSTKAPYPERYVSATIEPRTFKTEDGFWIHHFTLSELKRLFAEYFCLAEEQTFNVKTVHGRSIPGHVIVAQRF